MVKNNQRERLRPVTSPQNSLVKELRRTFSTGEPTNAGLIAIEGVRMIEEAIRSGLRIHAVFVSESASGRAEGLLPQLGKHVEAVSLPDEIFSSAVATENPQGVAALVMPRKSTLEEMLGLPVPLVIAATGVQDPGNLGTLLRSAEAFGANGVLLTEGTVGLYNAKVMRAAAGSLFRLPAIAGKFSEFLPALRKCGMRLLATSSHKGKRLSEYDFTGAVCILIGNEGAGVPKAILGQADEAIAIPHSPKVESLNAGVAASVILYEAQRQRLKVTGVAPQESN